MHFVDGSAFSLYGRPTTDPSIPLEKAPTAPTVWGISPEQKMGRKEPGNRGFIVVLWRKNDFVFMVKTW